MKIIRNGIEIALTTEEMRMAYEEKDREYLIEDIKNKLEDLEIDESNLDVDTIADIAKSTLENHDSYWECYWMAIEYAIEERNKEVIYGKRNS